MGVNNVKMDNIRVISLQEKVWRKRNYRGYEITIPKEFVTMLGWRGREKLAIILDIVNERLIVTPARKLKLGDEEVGGG